jgi:hypothetical protein
MVLDENSGHLGWKYSSVVQDLLGICEAQSSIFRTAKNKNRKQVHLSKLSTLVNSNAPNLVQEL